VNLLFSEMAVSDGHGGGLTLQRVLGSDLDAFDLFVHPGGFARQAPPARRFAPRSVQIDFWPDTVWCRRLLGCTMADRLARRPGLRRAFCRRAAVRMRALLRGRDRVRCLACPQGDFVPRILGDIRRGNPFPYVTWMMDDHCLRREGDSWRYDPEMEDLMRAHLQGAAHVFVISPALGRFYRERFGVEATVLFGPADPVGEPRWDISSGGGPIRCGYFGHVGPWQVDALEAFVNAAVSPRRATLDVWSRQDLPEEIKVAGVSARGAAAPEDVVAKMREYDAVLLPISFKEALANMSHFNIATKMSECLASGTMTLAIGPSDSAMVDYLAPEDAAVVVTSPATEAMRRGVEAVRDPGLRRRVLANARRLVATRLSVEAARATWRAGWEKVGIPGGTLCAPASPREKANHE